MGKQVTVDYTIIFEIYHNNVIGQGIELTEGRFIELGAITDEEGIFSYIPLNKENDTRIYLTFESNGIIVCQGINCPLSKRPNINHVHQLQNFYFAITGEELPLNKKGRHENMDVPGANEQG